MGPDRLDDVEFKIVEAPEPAPRRRRRGLAVVATLVVAGGLAAGATALASSDEPAARAPAAKPKVFHMSDGMVNGFHGHGCSHGGRRHHDRPAAAPDTALNY